MTYAILLLACSSFSTPERKPTLGELDKPFTNTKSNQQKQINPKSDQEIRNAYTQYLSNTSTKDSTRQSAINRLAELEFEVSNKLLQSKAADDNDSSIDDIENQNYLNKLNRSIELFTLSLNDYPKAKGNDYILYQLARAYDQKGEYEKSIELLIKLVTEYPQSNYFVESQFRIAEARFSQTDYIAAEDAYTEVVISPNNQIFYERAIFKRGWARFKQSLYEDAVDDYLQAITYHNFDEIEKLDQSEKERFEEYFRAVGLSFSNLGGAEALYDFFANEPDFQYLFYTYSVVSDIYLKQERFTDAAEVLEQFISRYPDSKNIPIAHLEIVNIWQESNFLTKLNNAIESLYVTYNSNSRYWKSNPDHPEVRKSTNTSLRQYVLLISEYFHSQYQVGKKTPRNSSARKQAYQNATKWYKRYLKDFSAYARQDKIYSRYAQLLASENKTRQALALYERAAYDGNLILDKQSAYATVVITDKLYKKNRQEKLLLENHIKYSLLYAQLYQEDPLSENIVVNAAQLAYNSKRYGTTIELANALPAIAKPKSRYSANLLRAQAHFNLEQYPEAENMYGELFNEKTLNNKDRKAIQNRLALTIYRQANLLKEQNKVLEAGNEFTRISDVAKKSDIAATGLYDAIALYSSNKLWQQTIASVKRFQSLFPKHKFNKDVTKTLSVAYLSSNQGAKAAEQFEKISSFEQDRNIKMTALWQAAELYESNKNYKSAIRSYREYANNYKKPYGQYMESMSKLIELYTISNNPKLLGIWRSRIIKADQNAKQQQKTDRTKYIASKVTLDSARNTNLVFNRLKLIEPLNVNLRKKKKHMQDAIKMYGQASSFGISEITTESTYAIAQIYQDFSEALLNSERPKSLSEEELEQYNILLEDQAYPFEDKAIEFYEINLSRIKEEIYDDWVEKSISQLKQLFPVKYNRKSKIDGSIDAIQ